jgi:hypothetical protein
MITMVTPITINSKPGSLLAELNEVFWYILEAKRFSTPNRINPNPITVPVLVDFSPFSMS